MSALQRQEVNLDEALLMNPDVGNKRSLASSLSIDNNGSSDNVDDILPTKRRKRNVDSKWDLNDLPKLPFLYLKEKTSVVVLNGNPQQVASRIVNCAKSLYVYGQYNGEKAKASLTVDNLEFSIQLFKDTDETSNLVIVEIQRTNGSTIQFHKIARALLEAAREQKEFATPPSASSSSFVSIPKDYRNKKKRHIVVENEKRVDHSHNEETEPNQEEISSFAVEMVDALLKKDRVDANLLGMESLQLLTTSQSSSDAMVTFVSNIVITGEKFHDIKDTISSLIANYTTNDGESTSNNVEDGYYQKMRVCALTVLFNSLKNFFKDDSIDSVQIDSILLSDNWLGDHGLLTLLIGELKNAKTNPNDAYLAGKSLEIVLLKSMQIRSHASKLDVQRIVSDSLELGSSSYPLLQSVSNKILQCLG